MKNTGAVFLPACIRQIKGKHTWFKQERPAYFQSKCCCFSSTTYTSSSLVSNQFLTRTIPSGANNNATIYAPSTASGKAAISIIRISGPDALSVWYKCTAPPRKTLKSDTKLPRPLVPPPRHPVLRTILRSCSDDILDEGLVLYFPRNRSLTGEDLLELHIHGSPAVVQALLSSLSQQKNFRPAEQGEFTMRAFENGKMDLTQVEGLRDLLDAETETQRNLAIRQTGDQLSQFYNSIRSDIISSLAMVEAIIDFGEEEQIDPQSITQARNITKRIKKTINRHLEASKRTEILRSGIRVAIYGPPNVGKSTLINWLAKREAAIVSPLPGTTRDIVELSLNFHGYPIILSDTAGLRSTQDLVEKIGIDKARNIINESNIKLLVLSAPDLLKKYYQGLSSLPLETIISQEAEIDCKPTIILINKMDEISKNDDLNVIESFTKRFPENPIWSLSLKNNNGLNELSDGLQEWLKKEFSILNNNNEPVIAQARQVYHLKSALAHLDHFLDTNLDNPAFIIPAAESLRLAAVSIGKITGRVDVEEILGEIFSSFCIGK